MARYQKISLLSLTTSSTSKLFSSMISLETQCMSPYCLSKYLVRLTPSEYTMARSLITTARSSSSRGNSWIATSNPTDLRSTSSKIALSNRGPTRTQFPQTKAKLTNRFDTAPNQCREASSNQTSEATPTSRSRKPKKRSASNFTVTISKLESRSQYRKCSLRKRIGTRRRWRGLAALRSSVSSNHLGQWIRLAPSTISSFRVNLAHSLLMKPFLTTATNGNT